MNKEIKVRTRPAAITLTTGAEARIAELMSRAPEGAIGVSFNSASRLLGARLFSRLCNRGSALR